MRRRDRKPPRLTPPLLDAHAEAIRLQREAERDRRRARREKERRQKEGHR